MSDELRQCKDCNELKPLTDFSKLKDGLRPHCRPCAAARLRAWREKNKDHVKTYYTEYNKTPERKAKKNEYNRQRYQRDREYHRRTRLPREFGITVEQYDEMLAAQNNRCAICEKPCKSGRKLAIDHCHNTDRVRGLLCMNCNRAIGWLEDDVDRLMAAAAYILSYRDILQKEVSE